LFGWLLYGYMEELCAVWLHGRAQARLQACAGQLNKVLCGYMEELRLACKGVLGN